MTTLFARFLDAVDAPDDDAAEALVTQLQAEDAVRLVELLGHAASDDRRWWAARGLALIGGGDSAPALVDALDDDDAGVRAAAALALAHLHARHPQSVAPRLPALALLLADELGMVRQAATDSLTLCGDDAVEVLAATLATGPQPARTRAMMALRKIASFPAAGVMFQYLNDENYLVHTYAYEGLDEMGLIENVLLLP